LPHDAATSRQTGIDFLQGDLAMDELFTQVRRARRRLTAEQFLQVLAWCWFAALFAALALIAVGKFCPLRLIEWAWSLGALGLGVLAAGVWTYAKRLPPLAAALEIDRRFGLKERISSTLAMPPDEQQTQAGQALLTDAVRRVGRIDVAQKFRVRVPRLLFLPLVPAAALAVALWIPAAVAEETETAENQQEEAQQPEVKRTAATLQKRLAERRDKAEKNDLKDATELLKKLEDGTKEISAEPRKDKALVKLNDLARQIDSRRQQLGGADKIKQQLDQLKNFDRGPAEKFAQALSKGDFKKAADELDKLKQDLNKGNLDQAQKEELAKQLEAMQQKIDQMAKAADAAKKDLQNRADQLRQAGREGEANKLEEQIAKLAQQAPQMQKLQELAQNLGQCAECMKQGQAGQAAQQLQQAMDGLKQLQRELQEMEMLDGAMEQLAQARQQMTCPKCQGAGCKECQGMGMGGDGEQENLVPGFGLGAGKGDGARPEQKTTASFYDSQVRQNVGKGSGLVTDLVSGPNVKGKVEEEIQQQFEAARKGSTDPLSGRRMPKKHSEHAREYFDRFREGK
jgi:hypothetical protein